MRKNIKLILTMIGLLGLTSCAHMNSDFDCPMKNGVRCQSLDEVNAAVDRGEIGGSVGSTDKRPSFRSAAYIPYIDASSSKTLPVRYPDDVMRVWIAPYEDSIGNYHQASSVYTVTHPSYWIGNPPKEITGV